MNKVLASEIVCVLRYKRHYFIARGLHAEPIAQEFLQHATDEHCTPIRSRCGSHSWAVSPT